MTIRRNVSLAARTWFRVGGPARWYCEPRNAGDFREALAFARRNAADVFALGEGANVLVSDAGFDGLVLRPRNAAITCARSGRGHTVTAGAGAAMQAVIDHCLGAGYAGLEVFSGIPGTVGGCVYINIHYFEHLLSQFLISARVIDRQSGAVSEVPADWFAFGYDTSRLQRGTHLLLDATLRVRRVSATEAAYATGRRDEIIRHRERRYPCSHTCGSFFQNFTAAEVGGQRRGGAITSVAYYLDALGIKGKLRAGGAVVSHQHANMLVNTGTATAADIARLARRMQELLRARFGLVPRPECQLVGFRKPPLLAPAG